MALRERVQRTLDRTGVPRAGRQTYGDDVAEQDTGRVRVRWGRGEPFRANLFAPDGQKACAYVLAASAFDASRGEGGFVLLVGDRPRRPVDGTAEQRPC